MARDGLRRSHHTEVMVSITLVGYIVLTLTYILGKNKNKAITLLKIESSREYFYDKLHTVNK